MVQCGNGRPHQLKSSNNEYLYIFHHFLTSNVLIELCFMYIFEFQLLLFCYLSFNLTVYNILYFLPGVSYFLPGASMHNRNHAKSIILLFH